MIADNAKVVMALRSIQNRSGLRKTDGDIWSGNSSWGNPWIYVWKNENGRGRIVQLLDGITEFPHPVCHYPNSLDMFRIHF